MEQVVKIAPGNGYHKGVGEENGLKFVSMDSLKLAKGESWQGEAIGEETVLVTIGGACSIDVQGKAPVKWEKVGGRANMFTGVPGVAYIPRQTPYTVTGLSDVELVVFKAKTDEDLPPRFVAPEEIKTNSVGAASWRRDVKMLFAAGDGRATRLIVGETINPMGNWSGFPPHKHDVVSDEEYPLEEIYVYKINPPDGFGVQVIYGGNEGDSAHILDCNTVASLPSGYHPGVAAPGNQLGFVWALAGDARNYKVSIDPRYAWLSSAELLLKELS